MVSQTDSLNSNEKNEKPHPAQLDASRSQFDSTALLADHKSLVGHDQKSPRGTASLANPETASLFTAKSPANAPAPIEPARGAAHAPAETREYASKSTDNTGKRHTKALDNPTLFETIEFPEPGQTLEQVARQKLGHNVPPAEFKRYLDVAGDLNSLGSKEPINGGTVNMPGRDRDGTLMYTNPRDRNEHFVLSPDDKLDVYNTANSTRYHQDPLDKQGSYKEQHKGPKQGDNYEKTYIFKDNLTYTDTTDEKGNTTRVGSNGARKVTDKEGNWKVTSSPLSPMASGSYDKKSDTTVSQNQDGSIMTFNGKDKTSTTIDPDGTKTFVNEKGAATVDHRDAAGRSTGYHYEPGKDGSYTQHGWGPKPSDNYDETYNSKTGTTVRVEAQGTPESKTTTSLPDGTIKVLAKNGDNYQRNPDGSEHHWGNKTFDKPPYDYKHDGAMNQARENLYQSAKDHIPQKDLPNFEQNMAAFESRAQKEHLPPQEITKTYAQMSGLLNAKDAESAVSSANRAMLTEQLLRETAFPQKSDQGKHNTCNVTTIARETLTKNPSKAAEMIASTAVHGEFTSADGKVIKIDQQSLMPGAEESSAKTQDGDRSFATQVLNVAMANDVLSRRNPPVSYVQRTPDRETPGDTGERNLDASRNVITAPQQVDGKWISTPVNNPGPTDHELALLGKRYNGDSSHVLDPLSTESGVDFFGSTKELGELLKQYKDQRHFPVTVAVDGSHSPIAEMTNEAPGYGGHFVSVTDYDEKHGRVKITNQWGSRFNGWVSLKALYENSSGAIASRQDGIDSNF
jgi:hypothetical protein